MNVNHRQYNLPNHPVVVICIDGCADEYLDCALSLDKTPHLARMIRDGWRGKARGALPSFTNVNNTSIVTGVAPSVHGIPGNFFINPENGEEVMMNSHEFIRCPDLLTAAQREGRKVAFVTAKNKLRTLLGHHLVEAGGIAFSAEKAGDATLANDNIEKVEELVGYPTPPIYSADASLFVFRAGAALLEKGLADFLYLSTTDYLQHKFAPDAPEMLAFHEAFDQALGRILACGASVVITADHGMNAKNNADGTPKVLYLETLLNERFGEGTTRVICPITDPYVVHHGALGSYVQVHLGEASPPGERVREVADYLIRLEGVTEVLPRDLAALKLELPLDRLGDLTVLSARDVALGKTPADHDLSQLQGGLRSHGGRYEEMVPLISSQPLTGELETLASADPRNFDAFKFACP
ncbi:MAG: phosphonoacetate hydrolase [Verrucomicrobiota bacterium JB023]|nr:phosphonoacetate hydrolase [Verrucomicrobiota bacterium JB023]